MTMKNPRHPGRSIRSTCLEPLGLSISEGGKILGVTRQALNNGNTEETWLRMQLAYDLAAARKYERTINVRRQPSRKNCCRHPVCGR